MGIYLNQTVPFSKIDQPVLSVTIQSESAFAFPLAWDGRGKIVDRIMTLIILIIAESSFEYSLKRIA